MGTLKHILLVEDDPNDVELTLTALAECHLVNEIVVARDGVEALDYLYRRGAFTNRPALHPAVILLDLKLPKVNGLDVLHTIRSDARMKRIPVVILSSSWEERDLAEGYTLGVDAYVVKSVDFHEFIREIKGLGLFWAIINEPPPAALYDKKRGNGR
jgi:CheY-like chemotaxis protein